jgi:hypothetical protein
MTSHSLLTKASLTKRHFTRSAPARNATFESLKECRPDPEWFFGLFGSKAAAPFSKNSFCQR